MVPPGNLLMAPGALPIGMKPTVPFTPAETAWWQQFVMRNPDMKVFRKTMRAAIRVMMREEAEMAMAAEEEARRTGVPVAPGVGPFTAAVREERRLVRAEDSGAVFDDED